MSLNSTQSVHIGGVRDTEKVFCFCFGMMRVYFEMKVYRIQNRHFFYFEIELFVLEWSNTRDLQRKANLKKLGY